MIYYTTNNSLARAASEFNLRRKREIFMEKKMKSPLGGQVDYITKILDLEQIA